MTKWLVRIHGHKFDLQELSDRFNSVEVNVTKDDNDYYYLGPSDFDALLEPEDIRSRAIELLACINGIAKVCSKQYEPVKITKRLFDGDRDVGASFENPYEEDARTLEMLVQVNEEGTREYVVRASGTVRKQASALPPTPGSSQVTHQQYDEAKAWYALASGDRKVEDALYFFHEETTWWTLRKVYEIIEDDFGQPNKMEKHGWADENLIKSFKASANDPRLSGRAAVHAPTARHLQRPWFYDPIPLSEAEDVIRNIIRNWLQWKLKNGSSL